MPRISARIVDCYVFRRGRDGDEWLLLRRAEHVRMAGAWGVVSGHIEDGETAYAAAARELAEETGLAPVAFYQASHVNPFYLADRDEVILSPVFCAEVAADAAVVIDEDHTDFAWVDAEEAARRLPWPGQRVSLATARGQFALGQPHPASDLTDRI